MKKSTIDINDLLRRFGMLVFLALVLVAEVAAAVLFVPGFVQETLAQNEALMKLSAEVAAQHEDLTFLESQDSTKLTSDYNKVQFALPDEKKVSGVITGITTLARQAGVAVDHLEFSPGTISSASGQIAEVTLPESTLSFGVKATPASLSVSGSRAQLTTFLSSLPTTSPLIGVDAVTLAPKSGTVWGSEIAIMMYYQPSTVKTIKWGTLTPLTSSQEEKITQLSTEDIFLP